MVGRVPIKKNKFYQKCKYCNLTNIHLKKTKTPECNLKNEKVSGCVIGLDFLICSDIPKKVY